MIVLFKGSRGKSKTLSMIKEGLKYLNSGWVVYTNLNKTRFKKIDSDYILNLSTKSTLFNAVLCIDEIELFFDSRDWNSQKSKIFSRFLQQIRKRNIIILCTAQFYNLIDIRLRQQIDYLVLCDYDKIKKISTNLFLDVTSYESGKIPRFVKIKYNAEPFFSEYDTLELIS